MTAFFERLAEERLREAVAAGEFDELPGHGRPLELEDLSRVPADLRASYCLLKSANVLPEEMQLKQDMLRLGDLIAACEDPGETARLEGERSGLLLRFRILMERRGSGSAWLEYADALRARLT